MILLFPAAIVLIWASRSAKAGDSRPEKRENRFRPPIARVCNLRLSRRGDDCLHLRLRVLDHADPGPSGHGQSLFHT